MDAKMIKDYVSRRFADGADAKTIYCELRGMGVDQDFAMKAVETVMQAPAQAPKTKMLHGVDADMHRAALGVKPDPEWVKITAQVIMVLCLLICWSLGAFLLFSPVR